MSQWNLQQGNLSQWNLHTWGYLQYDAALVIILKCPLSSSNRTIWKKSPPTDCHFTKYTQENKINPSIEHADRLRVVGNFSIGIYNLQILNVSLVDEGLYRCSYSNNNISHTKEIRVSLKSKYFVLTISNCIVLQTTYVMVFFMFNNLRWEVIVHLMVFHWCCSIFSSIYRCFSFFFGHFIVSPTIYGF
jgi:magnesium-transporting ATPase (P-type)